MRGIVYPDTSDHGQQHLWREIFLTQFDDPRPALALYSNIALKKCYMVLGEEKPKPLVDMAFNWRDGFTQQIAASNVVRRFVAEFLQVLS